MVDLTKGSAAWFKKRAAEKVPKIAFRPSKFTPLYPKIVRLRLIPGDYPDFQGDRAAFYQFMSHFNVTRKKGQICSSIWQAHPDGSLERVKNNKSRCVGCFLEFDWTAAIAHRIPGAKMGRISPRFAITAYVMADYHLDPLDFEGQPLGTNDEGEQRFHRKICEGPGADDGKGCPHCKRNLPVEWGRKSMWDLAESRLQVLFDYIERREDTCANCGSIKDVDTKEGGLTVAGLCCPNPDCGELVKIADRSKINELRHATLKCDNCGLLAAPTELLKCANCRSPRRPTVFDADFWVVRKDKSRMSDVVVDSIKIGPPHKNIPKEGLEPLDFEKSMAPEPVAVQCAIHNVPNPWGESSMDTRNTGPDEDTDKY